MSWLDKDKGICEVGVYVSTKVCLPFAAIVVLLLIFLFLKEKKKEERLKIIKKNKLSSVIHVSGLCMTSLTIDFS